jgi:hypothetical protein
MKIFLILLGIFTILFAFEDDFIKEIQKINDLKKREIKFFFDPKLYLSLKKIPLEPNELLKYPEKYLSLKKVLKEKEQFDPKKYIALKRVPKPKPSKILKIIVSKRRQRMYVYLNKKHLYTFKVSTARRGYWTPNGVFRPYSLERMHYSRKYHNSPMPWSVFFKGGYAIHGTYSISRLGSPASHGCVRVHPRHAKKIYYLIRKFGKHNTKIIIKS